MSLHSTVIVEDVGPARRRLEKMVDRHPMLKLVDSLQNGQEAIERIPRSNPEILLMDIQLKDKTAFEVLDQISGQIDSRIIFTTAYDQYAIQAFEVEAVDYLLKPFDEERFNSAIQRIIRKEQPALNRDMIAMLEQQLNRKRSMIVIPEGNKQHLFGENDILYLLSDKYYVNIITPDQKKLIRITLKKLDGLLPDHFLRINKSTIINLHQVSQIEYHKITSKVVMKDGREFFSTATYNGRLRYI
jgi:two-component system LytT family response regulator